MAIIFQSHHAVLSPRLQQRAEQGVHKLVHRLGRVGDAVVRVEEDGPVRRVEIVLTAGRGRRLVAQGSGRYFGPALAQALARLTAQTAHLKRVPRAGARRLPARGRATA